MSFALILDSEKSPNFMYSGIWCKCSRLGVDFFVLIRVQGFGEPSEYDKRISKIIHAFLWTITKYILVTASNKC